MLHHLGMFGMNHLEKFVEEVTHSEVSRQLLNDHDHQPFFPWKGLQASYLPNTPLGDEVSLFQSCF